MTLLESLQLFLDAYFVSKGSNLAAKLPGGLVPQIIPQNPQLPMCVVKVISGVSLSATHEGGISNWSAVRIEFNVYGNDYPTQEKLANSIQDAFTLCRGALAVGGVAFYANSCFGPRTLEDPVTRLVGVQVDILGLLDRATIS